VIKQHCAACHQLGAEGKKVGPVLDGIGLRGPDRLLEDILDPSRNVDAAFRTTTILNKEGQVLSGLLVREEGATLILVDNKGQEFSVPKADVDEQTTSGLSLMPGNWGEVIPPADVNELIAELPRQTQPPTSGPALLLRPDLSPPKLASRFSPLANIPPRFGPPALQGRSLHRCCDTPRTVPIGFVWFPSAC
jgi:putative heme-binding domain-containing protein